MSTKVNTKFLTASKCAERYCVHVSTWWRWLSEQKCPPPVKLPNGATRWSTQSLENWEGGCYE